MTTDAETTLNDLIARVGRVRRWLLALSALKIAALGLASVSLYIGLYAWIDHHMRFGRFGRVSAFVLFVAMIAAGLYYVIRVLRRDMTYAHAANHVENLHSFDQQLVAAVEYYEGKGDCKPSTGNNKGLYRGKHRYTRHSLKTCRHSRN